MLSLSVADKVLLMVEHQNLVEGIEFVTRDDVLTFMQNEISLCRAINLLAELYRGGYLTRIKSKDKKKRHIPGPKGNLYKINGKGVKRCNYLRIQGYKLEDQ
jgi:hypothetical protein